jgi:hypothetical protein
MATNPAFPLTTLRENLPTDERWLRPEEAAAIIGLDIKWLANAREGRKNLSGPPYIKVGEGRTAPIRYKLASLLAWMHSFTELTNTTHREQVPHKRFSDFLSQGRPSERWLFVLNKAATTANDVFEVLQQGDIPVGTTLRWLTLSDYRAQRFTKSEISLSQDMLRLLLDAGGGDISAGLDVLISK